MAKGFDRNYSHGRISGDDEGQTEVAIALDPKTKTIIIRYSKPMEWIGLNEHAAFQLVTTMAKLISRLKGVPVSVAIGEEVDNSAENPLDLSMLERLGIPLLVDPSYESLKQFPVGQWAKVIHTDRGGTYLHIRGKECIIALEPLPNYSNRGCWQAKLDAWGDLASSVDWADGWNSGRYYFDLDRAMLEIEAWLRVRGQLEEGA